MTSKVQADGVPELPLGGERKGAARLHQPGEEGKADLYDKALRFGDGLLAFSILTMHLASGKYRQIPPSRVLSSNLFGGIFLSRCVVHSKSVPEHRSGEEKEKQMKELQGCSLQTQFPFHSESKRELKGL